MNKNIEKLFSQTNYKSKINNQKKDEIRAFLMEEAILMNRKNKKLNILKLFYTTSLAFMFSLLMLNISNIFSYINEVDNTDNNKKIEKIAYKKYLWNNKSVSILNWKNEEIASEVLLYKVRKNKKDFQKINELAFSNYTK